MLTNLSTHCAICNGVADAHKTRHSRTCAMLPCAVDFGCSRSNRAWALGGKYQKLGAMGLSPLVQGVPNPLQIRSTIRGLPCGIGQTVRAQVWRRPAGKNGPVACRLSRSLKITGSDMDRSDNYDFLLTFHSNHWPILYCFRDIARYLPKTANFSDPTFITTLPPPPGEGSP